MPTLELQGIILFLAVTEELAAQAVQDLLEARATPAVQEMQVTAVVALMLETQAILVQQAVQLRLAGQAKQGQLATLEALELLDQLVPQVIREAQETLAIRQPLERLTL